MGYQQDIEQLLKMGWKTYDLNKADGINKFQNDVTK